MRTSDVDRGQRQLAGRIGSNGVPTWGTHLVTATRTSAGQYIVRPLVKPRAFISGIGFAQAVGVAVYTQPTSDGTGVQFTTAPSYGGSGADATFDFQITVIP